MSAPITGRYIIPTIQMFNQAWQDHAAQGLLTPQSIDGMLRDLAAQFNVIHQTTKDSKVLAQWRPVDGLIELLARSYDSHVSSEIIVRGAAAVLRGASLLFDGSSFEGGMEKLQSIYQGASVLPDYQECIESVNEPLGSGSSAYVYALGKRLGDGPELALKVYHDDVNVEAVWCDLAFSALNNDFGYSQQNRFYTVVPHLGDDLHADMGRLCALPLSEKLQELQKVMDACAAEHEKGVLHGDPNPTNILRTRDGGGYVVVDYTRSALRHGEKRVVWHPCFNYPSETTQPDPAVHQMILDERVDVLQLGITFLEVMLDRYITLSVLESFQENPLAGEFDAIPLSLKNVLWKATRAHPSRRYQDFMEMREAFRRSVSDEVSPNEKTVPLAVRETFTRLLMQYAP